MVDVEKDVVMMIESLMNSFSKAPQSKLRIARKPNRFAEHFKLVLHAHVREQNFGFVARNAFDFIITLNVTFYHIKETFSAYQEGNLFVPQSPLL